MLRKCAPDLIQMCQSFLCQETFSFLFMKVSRGSLAQGVDRSGRLSTRHLRERDRIISGLSLVQVVRTYMSLFVASWEWSRCVSFLLHSQSTLFNRTKKFSTIARSANLVLDNFPLWIYQSVFYVRTKSWHVRCRQEKRKKLRTLRV